MWDEVVERMMFLLENDVELTTILGGSHIYRSRARPSIQTPAVTYSVISENPLENLMDVRLQWDVWAKDFETVRAIEKCLYRLMHRETPMTVNGLKMWSQYSGSYDFSEDDESVAHRASDYAYLPAREYVVHEE